MECSIRVWVCEKQKDYRMAYPKKTLKTKIKSSQLVIRFFKWTLNAKREGENIVNTLSQFVKPTKYTLVYRSLETHCWKLFKLSQFKPIKHFKDTELRKIIHENYFLKNFAQSFSNNHNSIKQKRPWLCSCSTEHSQARWHGSSLLST